MRLAGKVAVVTGASMGIGEAMAKLFANEGASVVLSSRDLDRCEAARARIGRPDRTMAIACNVRHREDIDRLLALTVHNFGRVDIWVNNAGHGYLTPIATMDMPSCRAMFDTNFFGAIDGMQVAAQQMMRQGGGTIINVSSVAGHIPLPFHAAYSATKFALNAMGKAARIELRKHNINVMTVCPGFIRTKFGENLIKGEGYMQVDSRIKGGIGPDQVAEATLRGYLAGKREVVVPWKDKLAIKFYQEWPGAVEWVLKRVMKGPVPESDIS